MGSTVKSPSRVEEEIQAAVQNLEAFSLKDVIMQQAHANKIKLLQLQPPGKELQKTKLRQMQRTDKALCYKTE